MNTETVTVPCSVCKTPIKVMPFGGVSTGICDKCAGQLEASKSKESEAELRNRRWQRLIEPFKLYQDTDFELLPCKESSKYALRWQFGRTGLELVGPTGTGKTRTMFLIVRRLYGQNRSIRILGPGDFASYCIGWDTSRFEHSLKSVDVLVLDDFDKVPLTPIADGKFFGVIESRCAAGLPTLLTCECACHITRWRCGPALLRRLRDPFLFTNIRFSATNTESDNAVENKD